MTKIYLTDFKNIKGVCVETSRLCAIFLPEHGSKLVSLKDKETNYEILAQDENEIYLAQSEESNYVENEVSGADDLFPTIDPCKTGFADNITYPCHGEVLRYPHDFSINENELKTVFKSKKFGYIFEKNITGKDDGSLNISYKITNLSEEKFPCIFGIHCMLAAEEGGRVITFENDDEGVMMFDENGEFAMPGGMVKINEKLLENTKFSPDANAYKFYLKTPKKVSRCGYFNPVINKNIIISFDAKKLAYLGVWMNNGKFKGMYNAALEPCTMPYDSVKKAIEKGYDFCIPPKGEFLVSVNYNVTKKEEKNNE